MCCYPLKGDVSADHESQTSNWDGDVYRNIPRFWEKRPSKSIQIDETLRCCTSWHLPKANGRWTFFFPATRYMMSVRTKSFSPESTWWIRLQVPGILPSINKNPKFCLREIFKNLSTWPFHQCHSLWQTQKSSTTLHGSKLGVEDFDMATQKSSCSVFEFSEFKSFILRIQKSNVLPHPTWPLNLHEVGLDDLQKPIAPVLKLQLE